MEEVMSAVAGAGAAPEPPWAGLDEFELPPEEIHSQPMPDEPGGAQPVSRRKPTLKKPETEPACEVDDCPEMEVGDYSGDIACTDLANGMRLAHFHGNDIAFVEEEGEWHVWNDRQWVKDPEKVRVMAMAGEVAKAIFSEASNYDEEKAKKVRWWACQSCSRGRLEAMVHLAKTQSTVTRRLAEFDKDAHLLNCENGVIDLRTGDLLPHDRSHMMMKMCRVAYDPEAACPTWLRFLGRIQRDDPEMIGFIQRLGGYCLWGTSEEEAIHFLHGGGRNGKGKFLLTLVNIMGDYAGTVPFATFLDGARHNASGPNEAVAGMAGKRLIVAQESKPTGRFNESLIKTLTGGDRQRASFKYGHEFEFDPTFTLILAANDKPRIIDQSEAIKSRMKLIPFTVEIPEQERDLKLADKLWAEKEGILAWLVRGAVEWARCGMRYPEAVKEASKDYFADQDVVRLWLEECAEKGDHEYPAGRAYSSFKHFAEENTFFVFDNRQFKAELERKGFKWKKKKTGNQYLGFRLKVCEEDNVRPCGMDAMLEDPTDAIG
jgi:putative DNA primase/helicase